MGVMPSAREHALYDLRRARAGAATTIVLIAAVAAAFILREPLDVLVPVAGTAVLANLAVPGWVGVEPMYPAPTFLQSLRLYFTRFGVPAIGVFLIYTVMTKGDVLMLGVVPVLALLATAYSVYRWRQHAAALARVRGGDEAMSLTMRTWRHYLGYVVGLGAGLSAALAFRALAPADPTSTIATELAFAGVFVAGKLAVDVTLPQPPLAAARLSTTFLQLTAMSPLWFALPWGLFVTLMLTIPVPDAPFLTAFADNAVEVLPYMALASVIVFTALTTIAFAMEVATGEG